MTSMDLLKRKMQENIIMDNKDGKGVEAIEKKEKK